MSDRKEDDRAPSEGDGASSEGDLASSGGDLESGEGDLESGEGDLESGDEAPFSSGDRGSELPPTGAREAVSIAFAVTIATGAVVTFAFDAARAGQLAMLGALFGLDAILALVALVRLHRRRELDGAFRPASGDMTLAAVTAGVLHGAARIVQMALAGHGSPREGWIIRLYAQIGDTAAAGPWLVGGAVAIIAALEEIVWRGLVMRTLADALGETRALFWTAALFALAHAPTAWLLRAPAAGLNPLLVLAALGCGLAWGAMVLRTGRLLPAVLCHALFSWSVIEFPLWRL